MTLKGPDGTWLATGNEELVRYAQGKDVAGRWDRRRTGTRSGGLRSSGLWPGSRAEHRR